MSEAKTTAEAARLAPPSVFGLSVLRGAAERISERYGLRIANSNAPTEVALSGSRPGLDGAPADARDEGLRAVRLSVGGAFHSHV